MGIDRHIQLHAPTALGDTKAPGQLLQDAFGDSGLVRCNGGARHTPRSIMGGRGTGPVRMAGELHAEEEPAAVAAVVKGEISATEFFFKYCDGKFTDEDLNEAGNAFAKQYYGEDGLYLSDYAESFGNFMYLKPENGHDFAKFSSMMQARFEDGPLTKNHG